MAGGSGIVIHFSKHQTFGNSLGKEAVAMRRIMMDVVTIVPV